MGRGQLHSSDDYSRNLIRHKVTPVLKQINPAFSMSAASAAALLREDEDCLSSMAEEFIKEHFDGESIALAELSKLHRALASRVFRKLSEKSLSREHVESLFGLLEGSELAELDLPGAKIRREQGRIYFKACGYKPIGEYAIKIGESLLIPEAGMRINTELALMDKEVNGLFKTYCFKYESICGNISCTARKAGDRYRPAGRNCSKTLKSLFMEAKMTQRQRNLCPVFRDEAGILAVYPFPADERTVPQKGERVVKITIEKIKQEKTDQ